MKSQGTSLGSDTMAKLDEMQPLRVTELRVHSTSLHLLPLMQHQLFKKKIKVYKKSETSSFWQNFYIVYNKALFHPNGTKENLALTSVGVILQTRVRQLYTK